MAFLVKNGQVLTISGNPIVSPAGDSINNQNKIVTPSEIQLTVTADSNLGYTGLGMVTVEAIPSTYIGSQISTYSSSDLIVSGSTIIVPAGYYEEQASKSVSTITLPTTTASSATSGFTSKATISRSTSDQYINIPVGYNTAGGYYKISAVPNGSATTPTTSITANPSISVSSSGLITATASASKSITPTVSAGYVSSGTAGTVSVSGSNTQQLTTQAATTITPSTSQQTAVAAGKYTTGAVIVAAMPTGTAGTPTANKGSVSNYSITITPSVTNITGYITGSTKTGTGVVVTASELVSGTKQITTNGTAIDVTNYAAVDVAVPTGSTIKNQNKSVSPTETEQTVTYDVDSNNYTGLGTVTIGAISSTYIGSEITQRSSTDLTASGATITVPAGYYSSAATKSVASGTAGTPSATKSAVSNHSISITPSVTNTTGYITGSTKTGTAVTVTAAELVAGSTINIDDSGTWDVTNAETAIVPAMTLPTTASSSTTSGYTSKATISRSASNQYINIPPGYNSAGVYYTISAVANMTLPTTVSSTSSGTSKATISRSTSNQYINIPIGYNDTASYYTISAVANMTLPTSASSSSSGTSKATISRSTSNQYINIPVGYNDTASYYTISAVANGSATGPTSLSGTSATVSTGTNTLTLTKTGISTTPTVSAGYVSSATSSTATVTLTASVTTKAAATYYPSTSDQTIATSQYLTGAQTIKAVTISGLSADKVLSGTTIKIGDSADDDRITSVTGSVIFQTYYTGSTAPSSSLGVNGDIYLQS